MKKNIQKSKIIKTISNKFFICDGYIILREFFLKVFDISVQSNNDNKTGTRQKFKSNIN